ncbi:MAG: DNA-directed polymerase [Frankiales bacterium]|nr:DNA-directed polymerase [Frankiales bacterium]
MGPTQLSAAPNPGAVVAVVPVADSGFALAWQGGSVTVPALTAFAELEPRWLWWSARTTAPAVLDAGVRPSRCWDLGTVGRLLHGLRRDDAAAVWAAEHGLPEPPHPSGPLDLLDLHGESGDAVRPDGQLSREWLRGRCDADLRHAEHWARLAVDLQVEQEARARALPDPRRTPTSVPMTVLTSYAESAASLLAVELERDGLPVDVEVAAGLLHDVIGPRPADVAEEHALRARRDDLVLQHFAGEQVDLRSPGQVRALLARIGVDVPDTRSWRLEPYAKTSPAVAALLTWRKAERTATTYGWRWLDDNVADGRLRGAWGSADAAAGRMTAQAGLHNLPVEMRPAVRAEPGHLLVRADLGQIEPRVLATVSGDAGLAAAAREPDMYTPVAAALRCDRPTAKVSVLAAMYGQTSGTAGAALRDMDRAYPAAMAYLRSAEDAGLNRRDIRTYGGRLLRLTTLPAGEPVGEHVAVSGGFGRFARNAMVQGAAAELFKAWAGTVRAGLTDLGGEIVLCLHDELLVHVPADRAPQAAVLLSDALARTAAWWACGSGVRFVAEVTTGESWADTH